MRARAGRPAQRGFSIIELMVSVTISIIMFAVIIELFASNKEAYRLQEGASILNENARFAVSHLQFYMRLADHWGGIEPEDVVVYAGGVPNPTITSPAVTDCTDTFGNAANVISNVGFHGYDGTPALTPPLDCIVASNYEPLTDAFFIRYGVAHEDARAIADASLPVASGAPVIPDRGDGEEPIKSSYISGANGGGIWLRTVLGRRSMIFDNADLAALPGDLYSVGDPDPLAITNYRFQSMLYYIRRCGNPAAGTVATACDGGAGEDGVPTLVRLTLNPDLTFTEQDIVSGVENMQLLYGVDTDGDFVADRYDVAGAIDGPPSNWSNVVSVRVSLIVANLERDNTVNDTSTYYMLDATWVPTDAPSFRRSQYDFTVQIRNMTRA